MKLDSHINKPVVVKMLHLCHCQVKRIKTKLETETP